MNKIKSTLLLILSLLCLSSKSQEYRFLEPHEMKNDVNYFLKILYQHHPNPYFFCSKDSVEHEINNLLYNLNYRMSVYDFAKQIGSLNHLFDTHTGILFDFISQDTCRHYIPNIFYINTNNELYIKDKYVNSKTKINAINGISATEIIKKLDAWIPNEQIGTYYKVKNYTLINYSQLIGLESPYKLNISYNKTQETINITDNSIYNNKITGFKLDFSERYNPRPELDGLEDVSFKIDSTNSTGIIYYFNCRINNDSLMQIKINNFFNYMNSLKIKNLIIDIRNNSGGSSFSNDYITKHIKHKDFYIKQTIERKVTTNNKKEAISEIEKYKNKNLFNKFLFRITLPCSILNLYNAKLGTTYKIKSNEKKEANRTGFSGNIYIIQGSETFSAALDFAYWFKFSKRGIIIGEETGETTDCFSDAITDKLPNSQLNFIIARGRFTLPNGSIKNGLKPDVYLKTDSENILLKEDEIVKIINTK